MKILFCSFCGDAVALRVAETRHCDCGRVHGHYEADGRRAVVSRHAKVIGIDNRTLRSAADSVESADAGHRTLAAWLMSPLTAPRVTWLP